MASDPRFHAWASSFEWLSDTDTLALPAWQHPIAFVYQFVLSTQGDGAGSLFYNHTEKIEHVARSFDVLGHATFADRVRRIQTILTPILEDGAPDTQASLIDACLIGVAADEVSDLDAEVDAQLDDIFAKLEAEAKSNGWNP